MAELESPAADDGFHAALAYARRVLEPPPVSDSPWPTLAAAAFFAVCALGFATAAILAPPPHLTIPVSAQAPL